MNCSALMLLSSVPLFSCCRMCDEMFVTCDLTDLTALLSIFFRFGVSAPEMSLTSELNMSVPWCIILPFLTH